MMTVAVLEDSEGNKDQVCQLRNPWGSFEWKGKWSDSSTAWREEDRVKHEIKDDGVFWMAFDDLKKYFKIIHIANINDDFHYSF
jgi:hypothetical protein